MRIYNLKKPVKNIKKIKILIPIIIFIFINISLIPFFYYVLSKETDLFRSIITSVIISVLIPLDIIIRQVLRYEQKTLVIDNKNIKFVIVQDETAFYYTNIVRNIDVDYNDKKTIQDIIKNLDKYMGLSLFDVDSYKVLKKSDDSITILFDGKRTKWKCITEKKELKCVLISKKEKIKMKFDDKYDNIKEIVEYFSN